MKELEEQCVCVCVKFCCKLGKNFTETFQLLNQAYGEDCMSRTQCYVRFKRFKEGRMSVGDNPRPGRPTKSTNDDHVARVRAVIRGNCRLTVREVADEVSISIQSCHPVFTDKLQMRRVSAKFVPRFLTDNQKENRVEISQELLANPNGTFLRTS
jgi:ribosomal protein L31